MFRLWVFLISLILVQQLVSSGGGRGGGGGSSKFQMLQTCCKVEKTAEQIANEEKVKALMEECKAGVGK